MDLAHKRGQGTRRHEYIRTHAARSTILDRAGQAPRVLSRTGSMRMGKGPEDSSREKHGRQAKGEKKATGPRGRIAGPRRNANSRRPMLGVLSPAARAVAYLSPPRKGGL